MLRNEVRSKLLKLAERAVEVLVPPAELGLDEIRLRKLSARQIDEFQKKFDKSESLRSGLQLVISSLVDNENEPVFEDADTDALLELPSNVVTYLLQQVNRLNSLDEKVVEQEVKN